MLGSIPAHSNHRNGITGLGSQCLGGRLLLCRPLQVHAQLMKGCRSPVDLGSYDYRFPENNLGLLLDSDLIIKFESYIGGIL